MGTTLFYLLQNLLHCLLSSLCKAHIYYPVNYNLISFQLHFHSPFIPSRFEMDNFCQQCLNLRVETADPFLSMFTHQ